MVGLEKKKKKQMKSWRGLGERMRLLYINKTEGGDGGG